METGVNIEELAKAAGIKTVVGVEALKLAIEQVVLLDRKQQDYGPHNIGKFGVPGLLVRINDKFERLLNLTKQTDAPKNESIEDSFMDMSNYCVIGRLILANKWTGGDYAFGNQPTK